MNLISQDLFSKKSVLFIASAVGNPKTIDKATQIKPRPSTTMLKVILLSNGKASKSYKIAI